MYYFYILLGFNILYIFFAILLRLEIFLVLNILLELKFF